MRTERRTGPATTPPKAVLLHVYRLWFTSSTLLPSIANADVVIALIGRDWVSATDAKGRLRLADPNDYVRLELEAALHGEVRVIPVLVRNATMPRADELPGELAPLAQRHAFELPDQHWPFATDALIAAIEDVAPALGKAAQSNRGEAEAAGSSSALKLALDKLDINRHPGRRHGWRAVSGAPSWSPTVPPAALAKPHG